ncbi:MAG TPA: metallophosphoesterase, partial [Micromonosporaceae bacterium]|nr:metallophosphoesterase [Micromonosporaceae bacterium]
MLGMLAFVATVTVILGLIHLYLWKRLVRDTTRPGRWRRLGGAVALVLAVLVPATMFGTRAGLEGLALPGYLWLAAMFYLLVIVIALEVPMLVARLVLRRPVVAAAPAPVPAPVPVGAGGPAEPDPPAAPAAAPHHDQSRRLLLARGAAIFAGLTAAGITGYGVTEALGPPRLRRVQV